MSNGSFFLHRFSVNWCTDTKYLKEFGIAIVTAYVILSSCYHRDKTCSNCETSLVNSSAVNLNLTIGSSTDYVRAALTHPVLAQNTSILLMF